MRISSGLRIFVLLALGLVAVATRVSAQGVGFSFQAVPAPIAVSNNITYTIIVTNLTGATQALTVTNTFTGTSFQLIGLPTSSGSGTATISSNNIIFSFALVTNNGLVQMGMVIQPTSAGSLSDLFAVATNSVLVGSATFAVQVTNQVATSVADLAVAMTMPASAVFTNDWVVYSVNVTNLGPGTAPNVFLTNTLPASVIFKSVSPAFTRLGSGTNVIFSLGTLTNQAFIHFQLTVQPTNTGTLTFSSAVNTNTVNDPNPTNNLASNTVTVLTYFAGQFTVSTNSKQVYNAGNGLMEQSILVSNAGTNAVAAVRVVVTGLTNQLFNSSGTNNGQPFVVYATGLDTNQSVSLLLQYNSPTRSVFPFTSSQLNPFAVSVPDLSPPPASALATNLDIIRILRVATNGDTLIEFPTTNGATYTVVYSDNVQFSNAMIAPPAVTAYANRLFWADYGPPTTVTHPTNAPVRFYRVFRNP